MELVPAARRRSGHAVDRGKHRRQSRQRYCYHKYVMRRSHSAVTPVYVFLYRTLFLQRRLKNCQFFISNRFLLSSPFLTSATVSQNFKPHGPLSMYTRKVY